MKFKNDAKIHNNKFNADPLKRVIVYFLLGGVLPLIGVSLVLMIALFIFPKTSLFGQSPFYRRVTPIYKDAKGNWNGQKPLTSASIIKKVGPAVVGISVKEINRDNFFQLPQEVDGIGSGMIINKDGYVLTNYHVVKGAQSVKVIFNNGKEVAAKVVNYDAKYDIALIRMVDIDKVTIPGVVELGDSGSLQVGESIIAIGNPLGRELLGTATEGIVSAVNRNLSDKKDMYYIQTDAAINSGNSGGPLVNSLGQVIGINTAKISENSVEGLGFAIPINAVKPLIPNLSKPLLMTGITARDYNARDFRAAGLPKGIYVRDVESSSPAEKAGITNGDIITRFDGVKVKTADDLNAIQNKHKSGDVIKVQIYRAGRYKTVKLKLIESTD